MVGYIGDTTLFKTTSAVHFLPIFSGSILLAPSTQVPPYFQSNPRLLNSLWQLLMEEVGGPHMIELLYKHHVEGESLRTRHADGHCWIGGPTSIMWKVNRCEGLRR